jgi:cell division protein ZapA
MNDTIKINLNIADAYYPITIQRDEEELMRRAAKQVNERLNLYREKYRTQPLDRLLAMVAYQFAQEKLMLEKKNDTSPYKAKIEELTDLLEKHFEADGKKL